MIRIFLFLALWSGAAALVAETPDWSCTPAEAETSARSLDKPVLFLWQAGPGAVAFTQGVDVLFSTWPGWAKQAAQTVIFTRARAWEGPLPPSYPQVPDEGRTSALVLWDPASGRRPLVWTEVPPVLELSRALSEVSGRPLDDPYNIKILSYSWRLWTLTRMDQGPVWYGSGPDGETEWVEEGPLGSVLVLREVMSNTRAAFPLEGTWSYLFDSKGQSWTPWNSVLVKPR